MKISTKGRYGLRVMIDLAVQAESNNDKFISLSEISARQKISVKYLEMIVGVLAKSGLVISLRGKFGGYKLVRDPSEYTVGQILRVLEGNFAPVECLECEPNRCKLADECITLPMWKGLYKLIDDYFDGITLKDLLDNRKDAAGSADGSCTI